MESNAKNQESVVSGALATSVAAGSQAGSADIFRRYWLVLLASRWLVINTAAISLTAGILYAFRAVPIYEAVGQLQINPEGGGLLNGQGLVAFLGNDTEYLQTQYRVLQSRTLLEKVVNKVRLDEDPRYKNSADRVGSLSGDLKVTPVRLTRLVLVSSQHPDPAKAKDIVNAVMDLFISDSQFQRSQVASESVRQLRTEVQHQENELTKLIQAMQDYRVKNNAASLMDGANVVNAAFIKAKDIVDARSVTAKEAQHLATEAARWRESGKPLANFPPVAVDPDVADAKKSLADHESQFASITNRFGPKHPSYKSVASMIAADQGRLESESRRAHGSLQAKADLELASLEAARKKLADAEDALAKLNDLRVNYEVLSRKRERTEMMFQTLLGKLKEFDLSANEMMQNMRVVDYAQVPVLPIKPRKPLIISASMALGAILGCGLAFFLSYLNDSVKTIDDVESFVGYRFLGYVSHIDSKSPVDRDLLAFLQPTSPISEMFRSLRATIQLGADGHKLRTVSVTSTVAGEGKSLVASNYAIVTAQSGLKTLFIDADMRRPSMHQAFEVKNDVGLSTWLSGKTDRAEDVVLGSPIPNLDLICSGPVPKTPAELLVSARLNRLIEWAVGKYDRVIFDCPPVSVVSDPLIVASRCDGLLFVTRFNKVRREHVRRSTQKLANAGVRILGVCINDLSFETSDAYYYAYERYGYYSGYHQEGNEAAVAKAPADPKPAKPEDDAKA